MCLIVVAWRADPRFSLLLAGNRDEFHARASAVAAPWPGAPHVVGGRDLQAGGSWLALAPGGRFAAVTNVRDPSAMRAAARSRGELVSAFLLGAMPAGEYASAVWAQRAAYNPFNLLVGDGSSCWYVGSRSGPPSALEPGVHAVSNAELDTPWPKVRRARAAMESALASESPDMALAGMLADRERAPDAELPDTGVGLEWERRLSAPFIVGQEYGTRASSLVHVRADGTGRLVETSHGPGGILGGRVELETSAA